MNLDQPYLDLLKQILEHGEWQDNRTGIRTKGIFGAQLRFDLSTGYFPLLTTKKTNFRLIAEELFWFIKGSTDAGELKVKKVNIWDEWTPAYKIGGQDGVNAAFAEQPLGNPALDLGPVYGKQWRDFGGVDQLKEVVERIKTNPQCRRLIVSAWNPPEIPDMGLPPCHAFFQFRVLGNKLHLQMYQRSADMFLGVPFNIASYALLLVLVAKVTGLEVGEFIHTFGDCHIYENHLDQVNEQLSREPKDAPRLEFTREITDLFDVKYEDLKLVGYDPHPAIKGEVAV